MLNWVFDKTRQFGFVYGLALSGKKTISNYLKDKYGFISYDFNEITETLKKRQEEKEGGGDDKPIDINAVLIELKERLSKISIRQRFLVQNTNFYFKDPDSLNKLFEITGKPKYFFDLVCDNRAILDRYKKAQDNQEFTKEMEDEYLKTQEVPQKIKDNIKSSSTMIFPVNSSFAVSTAQQFVNKFLGLNLIVLKHDYNLKIQNTLMLISTTHRVLLVNIPYLINNHFIANSDFWVNKLNPTYSKKKLCPVIYSSTEEQIYYEMNPIHFDPKIVKEMIENYISDNRSDIEGTANIIILTGFLNNDLLEDQMLSFNLPLLDLQSLKNLGNILSFIQITKDKKMQIEETEIPAELDIKPKTVVQEVKKDDLDILNEENNKESKDKEEKKR